MANTKTKEEKIIADSDEMTPVSKKTETEKKNYKVKTKLDPDMVVTVKNGFQGVLLYKSKRTGERFRWGEFGDEQDMELQELKNARNASKTYFENNWFLIDDPEVLDYLGVSHFYKYALNSNTFDDLFKKSPREIKEVMSKLSRGQKKSVAYRAKQLIADEVIDSIKVITALEESLNIELIER